MLSFSVPPLTMPVLPVCSRTVSSPEPPLTVTAPLPARIESLPPSPTMVPGPASVDWFSGHCRLCRLPNRPRYFSSEGFTAPRRCCRSGFRPARVEPDNAAPPARLL